ncbi:hypothetical protein V5O48_009651 [Marasmius crinis-equi]|uniref:Uncharacterized protein n=1 Tax=Marasmius crinis-equi TaxID=585013 RepID=A0ABR3FAV1_9AGAR
MPPAAISQPSVPSTAQPLSSSTPSLAPATDPVNRNDNDDDDDDDDSVRIHTFELPASGSLTEARSREIIAAQQADLTILLDMLAELRTSNADLKAQIATRGLRRGRTAKSAATRDAPYSREAVRTLGKKCAIMVAPFLPGDVFGQAVDMHKQPHPQSADRFASPEKFVLGLIPELHEFLGDDAFRKLAIESTQFKNEFIGEVSSERSTALHNVRAAAGGILEELGLPVSIWNTGEWRERQDNTTIHSLLSPPPGAPSTTSSPLSSILFKDRKYDMKYLFFNKFQPQILRCILFGSGSLKRNAQINASNLVGNKWGVKGVNSSAISVSAMLLQVVLSGDETLDASGVGGHSKRTYWKNFQSFQKIINLSIGSEWASSLFKFYNDIVFAGASHYVQASETQEDLTDAIDQALKDLSLAASDLSPPAASDPSPPAASDPSPPAANNPPAVTVVPPPILDTAATTPDADPPISTSAPRISRAEREAHPLFSDGTEILGGEPLRGRPTLMNIGSSAAPPGPPAPPAPPAFPVFPPAYPVADTVPEPATVTQTRGGRGGSSRGRAKASSGRGGGNGSETEVDEDPSPAEALAAVPAPRKKKTGDATAAAPTRASTRNR